MQLRKSGFHTYKFIVLLLTNNQLFLFCFFVVKTKKKRKTSDNREFTVLLSGIINSVCTLTSVNKFFKRTNLQFCFWQHLTNNNTFTGEFVLPAMR